MQFPGQGDYVQGLVTSLAAQDTSNLPAPFADQVDGLKIGIESSSGMSWGNIVDVAHSVGSLVNATSPVQIGQAVQGLVEETTDIVLEVSKFAGAAAGVLNTIPLAGQVAGFLAGKIAIAFAAKSWSSADQAAVEEECKKRAQSQYLSVCQAWAREVTEDSVRTSARREPGDLFRNLLRKKDNPSYDLPPSLPAMYLALCGGEAGPMSLMTRAEGRKLGIPIDVRREMWALIKGIMSSVRDPNGTWFYTDHGRSLMALLNAKLYDMKVVRGTITDDDLFFAAERILDQKGGLMIRCPDLEPKGNYAKARSVHGSGGCIEVGFEEDLVNKFNDSLVEFRTGLHDNGLIDASGKVWKRAASRKTFREGGSSILLARRKPKGLLTVSGRQMQQMARVQEEDNRKKASLLTSGILVLGGGAMMAARAQKSK